MSGHADQPRGSVVAQTPVQYNCDFCAQEARTEPAAYDGKTIYGPWANMCTSHFEAYGIGLGTGRGQLLLPPDNAA